jgi:hypothetical protein
MRVRRRLAALLAAVMGLLLVAGCSSESEANAQTTGEGFAGMVAGGAAWLADFAGSENGEWLGYLLAAVVILWVLRRTGLMRG